MKGVAFMLRLGGWMLDNRGLWRWSEHVAGKGKIKWMDWKRVL